HSRDGPPAHRRPGPPPHQPQLRRAHRWRRLRARDVGPEVRAVGPGHRPQLRRPGAIALRPGRPSAGLHRGTRPSGGPAPLSVPVHLDRRGEQRRPPHPQPAAGAGPGSAADAVRALTTGFAGLVVTTGGTGFAPRDLTPEGTRPVLDREAPGLAEAMRSVSPKGRLSRGVAGTAGRCIVLNTPGSQA